jgi:hypothetical protein
MPLRGLPTRSTSIVMFAFAALLEALSSSLLSVDPVLRRVSRT